MYARSEQEKEKIYEHAVKLAASYVANGDIRLNGNLRDDNPQFLMLEELISLLYHRLLAHYQNLD